MKTKIHTKRRVIVFCGVVAVVLLTALLNFVLARQRASAAMKEYDLTNRNKDNSLALKTTLVGVWEKPHYPGYPGTVGSAQSFAINDNHFVVITAPKIGDNYSNKIVTINKETKKVASTFERNVSHGNGATWDSRSKQLLVANNKIYRLNDKYKYIDTKSVLNSKNEELDSSGIAYDSLQDQYWVSSGGTIRKVNKNTWKASNVVKTKHIQVNQDLAYNNGYVYRSLWTGDNDKNAGRNGGFDVNSGVVMQFGDDGTFTGSFYMPDIICELESVAFDGGDMYLLYNSCDGKKWERHHYAIAKVSQNQLKKVYHQFNIEYNANGGTGAPKEQEAYVGVESKLSSVKPTRANYTFMGWSTKKNATTKEFASGSRYVREYSTINTKGKVATEENVTLYAVWQEQKYTVNYNANGGTGAPASQTVGKTKDAMLSSATPTRTNYTFLGWSTSKTATTATYHPGDKYTNRKNVTLYAVWSADKYRISYNANGGTGAPASQTAVKTADLTLSSTTPTRTDFDFLGWATSAGGTVAYRPGDSYIGREDITLYAVWSVQTYTISFNANGGTGAPSAMRVAKPVSSVKIPAAKPTRSGFMFRGWATSASSTVVVYNAGDDYTNKSDIMLYAVWEENSSAPTTTTIEINYDANGGSGAPATTVGEPGNITLSSDTPTRDGYNFLGWATTSDAMVAAYQAGATAQFNTDALLYAVWARGTITLNYDANGGSGAPAAHSGAVGEITISPIIPMRDGYSFDGWAMTQGESASYQPGDSYRGSVSRKLYAVWSEQTVNINYYFCKSANNPVSKTQKVTPMRRVVISVTEPTRKAYQFLGWSSTGCTGSTEYDIGDNIYVRDNDVNLYAVWGDERFTVRFDVNGGSTDSFDDIIGDDNVILIPEREPQWGGYEFKGWSEDPDATIATYQPGDEISSNTDLDLYAVWERGVYGSDPNRDDGSLDDYNDDYDNDGLEDSDVSDNPKTGVKSLIGLLLIFSIGSIGLMTVAMRRRRN